jgi:hypothetical protein
MERIYFGNPNMQDRQSSLAAMTTYGQPPSDDDSPDNSLNPAFVPGQSSRVTINTLLLLTQIEEFLLFFPNPMNDTMFALLNQALPPSIHWLFLSLLALFLLLLR